MARTEDGERMAWGMAGINPAREVLRSTVNPLHDFPANASNTDGAKEVAQLAAFRAVQEFAFQPVMEALTKLQAREWDPNQPFLVADSVTFDWKTAPIRKYTSFEDFYHRELEPTWGKWTELQETYRLRIDEQISDAEARDRVKASQAKAMQERDARDRENKREGGRPKAETLYVDKNDVQGLKAPTGNTSEAALRRLRKDRPDIHARVLAGELKAHAGMIEAGFRKPRKSRRASSLDKILKLVPLLTDVERAALIKHLAV